MYALIIRMRKIVLNLFRVLIVDINTNICNFVVYYVNCCKNKQMSYNINIIFF